MNNTTWAIISIIGLILLTLLSGALVMVMWNAVIPTIFGLTTIDFGQALILITLCSLLFRSFPSSSSK